MPFRTKTIATFEHEPTWLDSLALQTRTMNALAIRFIVTRYGRENIGFLWVVLEPTILCIGVMVVWSIMKSSYEHGLQIIAVVFTGYMPLTLQRHLTGASVFILRTSKITLIHRNITYLDNLLSRFFMEFLGTTMAAAVIYAVLLTVGLMKPAHDAAQVLAGWIMMGCIAAGMGFLFAGLSELSEAVEKFILPFNYLTLPISGCFFMVEWLPTRAQDIVLYVPLVHAFEMTRAGMFGPSVITHYSTAYGFFSAAVLAALGLYIIERVRDRVQ